MFGSGVLAFPLQLFRAAKAKVCLVFLEQALGITMVEAHAIALAVGSECSANIRAFIPVDPQPAQVLQQLSFKTRLAALYIGVLDAQNMRTFLLASEEPIEQGSARIA